MWGVIQNAILTHFGKIAWANAILVANYDKKGIDNYIGGNTLMEMGLALYLNKRIFLLNPIPQAVTYKEEILALKPTVITQDLKQIAL